MHELIGGPSGSEHVADDFVVAGSEDTLVEPFRDHNKNLVVFLARCSARAGDNLKYLKAWVKGFYR